MMGLVRGYHQLADRNWYNGVQSTPMGRRQDADWWQFKPYNWILIFNIAVAKCECGVGEKGSIEGHLDCLAIMEIVLFIPTNKLQRKNNNIS